MLKEKIIFHNNHPSVGDMYQEIVSGFSQAPRIISPKYFYDKKGSHLFDQITETQDYYPTRSEVSILQKCKNHFVDYMPENCVLIEPGGGSYSKVMNFINELRPSVYVPIDISSQYLKASSEELADMLPWLQICAICDDYSKPMKISSDVPKRSRVAFFPGSSIGNFHPHDAIKFLKQVARWVGENGQLLIGIDLKKDKNLLERAYDDREGVTAKFNLNLLSRINQELSANFDLNNWKHRAIYNAELGRIEMHLVSMCDQEVTIHDQKYSFAADEYIHTECSYKYTADEFVELAKQAGFISQKLWLDDNELFSVHLLQVSAA